MKTPCLRKTLAAFLAVAGLALCPAAQASTFKISVDSGGGFNVTRSGDVSAAENVYVRAVSRSALAGIHFGDYFLALRFAAGETGYSVDEVGYPYTVSERNATTINDPRFTYYQSGGATGASRAYRLEVVDEGGFVLAAVDRTINYPSANSVSSSAFDTNSILVVNSSGVTVTDKDFTQAYHAVPCESYLSSLPREYLSASDARIHMTLDFQAAEVSDGYQYVQILTNNTSTCDNSAEGGNPGSPSLSCYLAGFDHKHSGKDTNYKKYSFPVTSAGSNSGSVSTPWSDLGNDIGDLCQQYFRPGTRAADGRLAVLPSISSLGVRFDASGSDNDDWTVKSVVARLQAVPAGPTLIGNSVAVTPAPVCKGSVVTVSLVFNEIVAVSGALVLSTTWGDLAYVAGSGANVLSFSGTVTAAAGTQLRITGLVGGAVRGLAGNAFVWPGRIDTTRTVDSIPAPPVEGSFFMLSTPAHLRWFADRIASYPQTSAALACDIDLSATVSAGGSFPAMGGSNGFAGTFDGLGHALSGLSVSSPDPSGVSPARLGLFGQIAAQGVVTNLVLTNANVSASVTPALVGAVCGHNLGTITLCSVSGGLLSTGPRSADGTGSALGGVCGENAGTVRACRVVSPLTSSGAVLYNRVKNDAVGGIAGVNAASGILEACYFHAGFSNVENVNITRGAVCGSNDGTIRRCAGIHDNNNYFNGAVGSDSGTVEDVTFPAAAFSSGEVCYALNGGVTDGSQPWYQGFSYPVDSLPQFSRNGYRTVYLHGSEGYVNEVVHGWNLTSGEPSPDYSNYVWTVTCSICGETATVTATGTAEVTRQPTCTEPGITYWTYIPPANNYNIAGTQTAIQPGVPAALGHNWGEPKYLWAADGSSCTATASCTRDGCGATTNETVAAALVPELSIAGSCIEPGTNTYAATFASSLFSPQTNAFEVAALGHAWGEATYIWAADDSTVAASNACTRCGETAQETVVTVRAVTEPTCTAPGAAMLVADFTSSAFSRQEKALETDPALGHDWAAPVWNWNDDYTSATATFACSRGDANETVAAAVERAPGDGDTTNCTAIAVHHGETFNNSVTLRHPVPYIDSDGVERQCRAYTVLESVANGSRYHGESGAENWYVVTNNITVGALLRFDDAHARLILCDGATLAVSDSGAIETLSGALTIYGQSGGTGAINATSTEHTIYVNKGDFTVNGGIIEAGATSNPDDYPNFRGTRIITINSGVVRGSIRAGGGIVVNGGVVESSSLVTASNRDIVLGWTNTTDSITAAAYYPVGSVSVRAGQRFWNGEEFVGDGEVNASRLAGKTLTPAYAIAYDLVGGSVDTENPSFYARESADIVLANPVRSGCDFAGWIGTGLSAPTNLVVIPHGSVGDRAYTATWVNEFTAFWGDGDGSAEHPYVITNAAGLNLLSDCVNGANGRTRNGFGGKRFVLGADIAYAYTSAWNDATGDENNFASIGTSLVPFCGFFDGRGHTVSGIRIYKGGRGSADSKQGLFGYVGGGEVRNVRLADARITGYDNVGGIVGQLSPGYVSNCRVETNVAIHAAPSRMANNHGGVAGSVSGSTAITSVNGCYSAAKLTVSDGASCNNVGGIVGYLTGGVVGYCFALGVEWTGTVSWAGPIYGNKNNGIVSCCLNCDCTADGATHVDYLTAYAVTPDRYVTLAPASATCTTYDVSRIDFCDFASGVNNAYCFVCDGTVYAPQGNVLLLALDSTLPAGIDLLGYAASAGTLSGDASPYTLAMPASGVVVTALYDAPAFNDPQGTEIQDYAVIDWLSENGFTQSDIDAIGHDAAATDKLYECFLLNSDFTAQDAGGALSLTAFAVSNGVISVTVQLERKAPLGAIIGYLYLYGANDLAVGFDRYPIDDVSIDFGTDDPFFTTTKSTASVSQSATATMDVSYVPYKFFKAEIGPFIPNEPEDPWEPEPDPDDPDPDDPEE